MSGPGRPGSAAAAAPTGTDGNYIMNRFTSNPEQRTALQFAFYNTLLFVLLGICLVGLFALYNMLYMFLTPMMWAVLVGTVLFPFKKKFADVVKEWLAGLQATNTPLVVGVAVMPYNAFHRLSENIFCTMISQNGAGLVLAYLALKVLSYERTFMLLISWAAELYSWIDSFILFFSRAWVFPLIVVYFAAYAAWVYVQEKGTINKKLARMLSLPVWLFGLSFVSQWFGPLRVIVFSASAAVLAAISAGAIGVEQEDQNGQCNKDDEVSMADAADRLDETEQNLKKEKETTADGAAHNDTCGSEGGALDDALSGDTFIRLMFSLCALLWVVRHDSALVLFLIPFVFAAMRRLGESLGVFSAIGNGVSSVWESAQPHVQKIVDVTVAGSLRKFIKVLFTSDQLLVSSLRDKMDVLSSVVVMAWLAFGSILVAGFVIFQLHGETVHLVRLISSVVSSQPDWFSHALNFTEDQLEENNIDIDDYVEQAYQQGRAWLAANVRGLASETDTKRADMLEEQVKQIVDRLYKMWQERAAPQPSDPTAVARSDWMTQLQGVTDLTALKEELTLIVKENLDTLVGIAKSAWALLAANVSFLTSVLAACAGIILGFGMDIVNFLIEAIVFLTMVYYLLASSVDRWLPLEWASTLAGVTDAGTTHSHSHSVQPVPGEYNVTSAIEHAIFGVFVLSTKMAVFYGLHTYFVHSLFDLNIVFVPTLLSAVFAAIPIMPPYVVCVLGLIELCLVRGETAAGIVFALVSASPVAFADAAFYREIKGSHPYVTGLAIIGGMYWLGLQGAIIGPIILCSFLVLVNVYMQFAKNQ